MKKKRIAIDGPAGAGKSTVARLTADRLGYLYVDTGAMYRALTYKAMTLQVPFDQDAALTELAEHTVIRLEHQPQGNLVFCDGQDVTEAIRLPQVSEKVSQLAKVPGVRQRMVQLQRQMAVQGGVVMDGRDIASQVIPEAECKFYLTASVDERARRRFAELKNSGFPGTLADVANDITRRDEMDSQREVGPLIQVPEAILIDTTGLTILQVVEKIVDHCQGRR